MNKQQRMRAFTREPANVDIGFISPNHRVCSDGHAARLLVEPVDPSLHSLFNYEAAHAIVAVDQ